MRVRHTIIGPLLALLVAASAVACSGTGDRARAHEARGEVFMTVDATRAQINAVRRALERDPSVQAIRFLTKSDAVSEFRRMFADNPDLVATVTREQLPTSFRVRVTGDPELRLLRARLGRMLGVDEVQSGGPSCAAARGRQFDVFMVDRATDAEIDRVRSTLSDARFVEGLDVLAKAGSAPLAALDPLPASFSVRLVHATDQAALRRAVGSMPGVDGIVGPAPTAC